MGHLHLYDSDSQLHQCSYRAMTARTMRAILTQCVNQRRDDGHERAHKQTYNQQPQEQVRLLHPHRVTCVRMGVNYASPHCA